MGYPSVPLDPSDPLYDGALIIQKPRLQDPDVWARNSYKDVDIVIPYEKLNLGWNYANKPSYQELNWFWNYTTQYSVHWNQYGIPNWDENSIYESGAFVTLEDTSGGYSPDNNPYYTFQSFQGSLNRNPFEYYRLWRREEHMNGLKDVNIDMPKDRDLLILKEKSLWVNQSTSDVFDKTLGDLIDVSDDVDTTNENMILTYDTDGTTVQWYARSPKDVFAENISINSVSDVLIDNPQDNEVLTFKEVTIKNPDTEEDYNTFMWTNSVYTGQINFNNIKNTPERYPCEKATKDKIGGVRMYTTDDSGLITLHIYNGDI